MCTINDTERKDTKMEAGMVAAVVVLTLNDGRTEEVVLEQSDFVDHCLFSGRHNIVAAIIPDGVTTIGSFAFWGCTSLAALTIPEGVTRISAYAFSGCTSLASVNIPEGVTTIGAYAFSGCTSLASATIPEGVTRIGVSTFSECSSLASVTIPSSVRTIASYAFRMCRLLQQVEIMNPLAQIYSTSFSDCNLIDRVNIHDNTTIIFSEDERKKLRDLYQGRAAWEHVFPSCPASNIKWPTSIREEYEAGFVDRATTITTLASLLSQPVPMEVVAKITGLRREDYD